MEKNKTMAEDIVGEAMRQGGYDPQTFFAGIALIVGIGFLFFVIWTIYQVFFE